MVRLRPPEPASAPRAVPTLSSHRLRPFGPVQASAVLGAKELGHSEYRRGESGEEARGGVWDARGGEGRRTGQAGMQGEASMGEGP